MATLPKLSKPVKFPKKKHFFLRFFLLFPFQFLIFFTIFALLFIYIEV